MIEYKQYHPFLRDILEFVVRETKRNWLVILQESMQLLAHNKSLNKSNVLAARNRRHYLSVLAMTAYKKRMVSMQNWT